MATFASVVLVALFVIAMFNAASKGKKLERDRVARVGATYADPSVAADIRAKKIWQGMTERQLIDSWGQPSTVTKQVLKTKVKNTYRYGSNRHGSSVYVENGKVTGWRQSK